ncbi:2-oxoglutarate dehydrogenase E1 component [Tieghemiomyces parasiticus]|uniref:2-oxoglutarate dehydrogenase, mitochondrial n=1 Tax=Tieghemiomyces parasiticus TaxID=78921 RepID=A0A9W7ZNY7_9FUNG|nr:2-oxoglutarate dehydrogenase E1 component [Tieghemiomyces parasiticus]
MRAFHLNRMGQRALLSRATSGSVRQRLLLQNRAAPLGAASGVRSYAAAAGPDPADGFLQGNAAHYVEDMYAAWLKDPTSVHASWQSYFKNVSNGLPPSQAYQAPPTLLSGSTIGLPGASATAALGKAPNNVLDHLKVQLLVRAYQVRGHHLAKLDPLGIIKPAEDAATSNELDYKTYGFTESDLDRKFNLGPGMLPGFGKHGPPELTLRQIIQNLQTVYCGSLGIEYTHIPDRTQCDWIRERFEIPNRYQYSAEEKRTILDRLVWSDSFERFIAKKWVSEKRFGLEGCEALIPGMKALIDRSVELGINSITMGMAHRGRLNVLSNVVRKPNESIFCEFSGTLELLGEGSGDVKYHLGMNYDRPTPSGKRVHLSLVANPSHLEAVDPVVLGKVRATQFYTNDEAERAHSMPVLLHGDAAFAAQGVVYETMGFSELPGYTTGGTIHIIVNNQIGFTTDPRLARSTPYCSDIAKTANAPIIHVNGDDVEAVVYACQFAAEWRQKWHKDVVIDIICYRRHGHNESDQPSFTQPRMYRAIKKQPPVIDVYTKQLVSENSVTQKDIDANKERVWGILEENYEQSKDYKPTPREWLSSAWNGFKSPSELAVETTPAYPTGAALDLLQHVGKITTTVPLGFDAHPVLAKILKARAKSLDEGANIDWPTAESLAFGSLLLEGKHVRLSGQDVERGTFSQRHSVMHNQNTEEQYTPLCNLKPTQAKFTVSNSSLSEYGALGFELGYSLVNPHSLIMWEAQFGDFANTAQVIIDQFIAAGEKKWLQQSGLVMVLPHGYDGQGPEHSSARIERYLQLTNDHPDVYPSEEKLARQIQDCSMQVVYCSTPANFFHVLRRQVYRDFRKPLICMTSKSLLRHPLARSTMAEMTGNTYFQKYIPEPHAPETLDAPEAITRHVLCTGQVYYALLRAREQNGLRNVAISRVEQITPFPYDEVRVHADKYPNATVVWCQEEPMNFGAWSYLQPRITTCLSKTEHHAGKSPVYAGRDPNAAVATGLKKQHYLEEWSFLSEALFGEDRKPKDIVSGVPQW